MGMLRDGLMPDTMVRITDDLYLPSSVLGGMSALEVADMIRQRGGLGPSLDTAGIQSSQEMFNEVFGQAMADEIMNQLLETQGVPDVVSQEEYFNQMADTLRGLGIAPEDVPGITPSVLELLQTGPVQPLDVEGGIGDVAGTGDVAGEEVVDLSQRTTDDLITIDDLMADTTASTVDGGDLIPENPWIYIGDGNFRHSQTGETVYNEDAATNPAYVVGGSYSGPESGTQDTDVSVNILGGVPSDIAGTGVVTNGGLVGDTVVQTPTGTPGTVLRPVTDTGDGGGDVGDGLGDGVGDGVVDGDGVRSELIMRLSQQTPITEQMFSRELFEPKLKELDNVAKAMGLLQDIARGFA